MQQLKCTTEDKLPNFLCHCFLHFQQARIAFQNSLILLLLSRTKTKYSIFSQAFYAALISNFTMHFLCQMSSKSSILEISQTPTDHIPARNWERRLRTKNVNHYSCLALVLLELWECLTHSLTPLISSWPQNQKRSLKLTMEDQISGLKKFLVRGSSSRNFARLSKDSFFYFHFSKELNYLQQ